MGRARLFSAGARLLASEERVAPAFDQLAQALEFGVPRRVALKMAFGLGLAGLSALLPVRLTTADDSGTATDASSGTDPTTGAIPVLQACAGLSSGAACTFTVGDFTVSGICQTDPLGNLVCVPPTTVSGPPPAVQACSSLQSGSTCTFSVGDRT